MLRDISEYVDQRQWRIWALAMGGGGSGGSTTDEILKEYIKEDISNWGGLMLSLNTCYQDT